MRIFLRTPEQGRARRGGFTLLELTLVLLALAMVAGLFLNASLSTRTEEKRDITLKRMQGIEAALLRYRRLNHRIPCPADITLTTASASYGHEDRTGNCDPGVAGGANYTVIGGVPSKTIGLQDEYMYDGWGRKFSFAVFHEFTKDCAFATSTIVPAGYAGIVVNDINGDARILDGVYLILSHGSNGHGGYLRSGTRYNAYSTNVSEHENCDCNSSAADTGADHIFIEADYTETSGAPTNRFDDLLQFATREQVRSVQDENGTTETCP